MEDLSKEPPKDINPYEVLQLETTASSQEVKSAYKKLALRHHPDKVAESARDNAHVKFQEIAFAYAILSEPRRRQRYDTTGNTSESIDVDDNFDWSSYFKAQFAEAVTGEKLNNFKSSYQHSEEEKRDVLKAYKKTKGSMEKVFDQVMMSNPLYDEVRFRELIEAAIKAGEVEDYASFRNEPEGKRLRRQRRAAKESTEAMEYAKELGVYDTLFNSGQAGAKTNGKGSSKAQTANAKKESQESALANLIQKNRTAKASSFLDDLEAKYVGLQEAQNGKQKAKGGSKRRLDEPPEELFEKNRQKRKKTLEAEVESEHEDDEDVVDLGTEDSESENDGNERQKTVDSDNRNGRNAKGGQRSNSGGGKKAKDTPVASFRGTRSRKAGARH
ncbi:hypothetical protein ACLMJK_005334 [Lecanora helva]